MNKRLPLIVAAGAGVLVLLVALVLVMPKRSQVSSVRAELATAQGQQSSLEVRLVQLRAMKQNAQSTRKQLDKIATEIPPTADESGLIRLMQLAADKAGVDLTVESTGEPTFVTDYSSIGESLDVTGDFFQIDRFLWQLESLPRVVKVIALTIQQGEYPLLTANITAETYTTDIDSGPGTAVGHQPEEGTLPASEATPSTEASPTP